MRFQRRHALVAFFGLIVSFIMSARTHAAEPETIAAGDYRLDLTVNGKTMSKDVVVEYQEKTILIRKPMQDVKAAFRGKIDGDQLTAESKDAGATINLTGKITAKDTAEGTFRFATPTGMELATGTFKLLKR